MLPVIRQTGDPPSRSRSRHRDAIVRDNNGAYFFDVGYVEKRTNNKGGGDSIVGSAKVSSVMITAITLLVVLLPAACPEKIPIGAIFEQGTDEVQSAFKFAMFNHNQNATARKFELQAYVDVINTADAYKLSRLICTQFSRGVFSMLGAVSPDSFDTLHSYSNTFQMPFVTPWFPEKVLTPSSGLLDFAISMRPDYHRAIIDTVRYYGWKKIIYLYDSHDGNLLVIDSGLHEGWSTPTISKFNNDDPLEATEDEIVWIVNLMYVGVGIGSTIPLFLMDRVGRKSTLLIAAIPKIISWLLIGLAKNLATIIAGRILAGIGCGITYAVMPMYLGEVSSKRTRGPLGTMMSVLLNIGMLLIYAIGLWVSRFVMAAIAIWVPVIFLLTFMWMPESSVFLTKKNRLTSAERTLQWVLAKDDVFEELEEIKRIVATEDQCVKLTFMETMKELCRRTEYRRAFGIALILFSALTFTGAAPILTYQSYLVKETGLQVSSNLCILITGCTIVLAGSICVSLVKSTGKRLLLLISTPICFLSLSGIAIFFSLLSAGYDVSRFGWVSTAFIVIYVLGYGLALNPVPLAYAGEIFPLNAKVAGAIFCSLYYAITTTTIVKFYQVTQDLYGPHVPIWTFTVITFVLWIFIVKYVPETEGKTLEEIQIELKRRK